MSLRTLLCGAAICLASAATAGANDNVAWIDDVDLSAYDGAVRFDDQVEPAQAAQPSSSQRAPAFRTASRAARTSRVPYMIGDQSIGLSGGLAYRGIDVAALEHPIFGGNRFNAAENSSPLPADRVYVGYRHFANAYESAILDQSSGLDVERFDLGFEKTALDGLVSVELRVPVLRQIDSRLFLYSADDYSADVPLADRSAEFGNLAVNLKLLLCDQGPLAVTAGFAVNCPTADDGRIDHVFNDLNIVLVQSPLVTTVGSSHMNLIGNFENHTVNLTPYIAWQTRPSRFFHQGFLQIDAPVNRSSAGIIGGGLITPSGLLDEQVFPLAAQGEIDQQTLLRLNLGFGYWLCQGERGGWLRGVAGVFEAHYTTALEDANPFLVRAFELDSIDPSVENLAVDLLAGPQNSNINQVNLTAGLVANVGNFQVTNGVIVPVTEDEDRSFDFEYSLQVNRLF